MPLGVVGGGGSGELIDLVRRFLLFVFKAVDPFTNPIRSAYILALTVFIQDFYRPIRQSNRYLGSMRVRRGTTALSCFGQQ